MSPRFFLVFMRVSGLFRADFSKSPHRGCPTPKRAKTAKNRFPNKSVFHSVPTCRTRNTEKHGISCSQYRKDSAIPLSRGRFWKTSGRTLWEIPCAGFCGKNFEPPLSSRKPGRKIPSPRKCFIFWIPSHDSELFGYGYYNSHNEVSKGGADCDSI